MNLLRYSAWLAQQQQQESITLPLLAAAFEKRLSKHIKGKANPFQATPNEFWVVPALANTGDHRPEAPSATKRQRKSAASEVLKAS